MSQVISGFSLTNRWLLYTSCMLAPAQFVSGINNNCPSNIGFLAYNWYTQFAWYYAIKGKQLDALCLLVPHFNLIFALTYLGGVTSGDVILAVLLSLGSAGVLVLNNVAAWISWTTNQPDGFGVYQFFFFGWRTLNSNWHIFMLLWQIFDTLLAVMMVILAFVFITLATEAFEGEDIPWWGSKYVMIPIGAAVILLAFWPLIVWTELIVARNQMESATDWVAVWLFVAQVGALLVPPSSVFLGCLGWRKQNIKIVIHQEILNEVKLKVYILFFYTFVNIFYNCI